MYADQDDAPDYMRRKTNRTWGILVAFTLGALTTAALTFLNDKVNIDLIELSRLIEFQPNLENISEKSVPTTIPKETTGKGEYEFYISPGDTKWAVTIKGKATAVWGSRLLLIELNHIDLENTFTLGKDQTVEWIQIGLAHLRDDGRWTIGAKAPAIPLKKKLAYGERIVVKGTTSVLKIQNTDLKKQWVVLTAGLIGGGTVHAHSRNDLFQ